MQRRIYPLVVPAGSWQEIGIRPEDGLFSHTHYRVAVIPKEKWDVAHSREFRIGEAERKNVDLKLVDGEPRFSYLFSGEQEWCIYLYTMDGDLCDEYRVYSLLPDLYGKRAFKGDLHIHTNRSDGINTPAETVINYRKHGFDLISITDHHRYFSKTDIETLLKNIPTGLKIFPGEEVHNRELGYFHYVNFNGQASVNELVCNDLPGVEKEVRAIGQKLCPPEGIDAEELAWRVWIHQAIKKTGGVTIFPHPYWTYWGEYHTQTEMSEYMFREGLFDVFEVLGGCSPQENNLQTALYTEQRAQGNTVPVVGSSDSHSSEPGAKYFDCGYTVVFADQAEHIPEAVLNSYSVAVESLPGEHPHVYGAFRLVKYTHFLLEQYFPAHNQLCAKEGEQTEAMVRSNCLLPLQVEADLFSDLFFGRQ